MSDLPRNVIEIVDVADTPDNICYKPGHKGVWIDGNKILVAEDGIRIGQGKHGEVTVTLTLMPTELHLERCFSPKEIQA